ncbi:Trophoblast glycoprotein [Myotis brandtii]|uniref:Trophoblast glycoprotein n=1 Tax=Myotis brandtii TaxID=109478 RepID=S7PH89_MYOBR|nr:Trophoblast glycoprotein [Myotis brandtii]
MSAPLLGKDVLGTGRRGAELQGLPQVRVFLDNNPWVCDCHMVDMVTWLKETEIEQGKGGGREVGRRRDPPGLWEGGPGDGVGPLGWDRPVPALGKRRRVPLLTLLSRSSQVLQRIQREAPTKEARGACTQGRRQEEERDNCFAYLPHDVLTQLPSLRHLDLRNNSLVSLTYVSFRNLTHLESLHLEDNALKALHNGTLVELQGLPQVRVFLDNNPWVCDCHMVDMVTWLKETEIVQGKAGLTCAFPEKMRNRVLLELNSSDLDCDPILPPSLQTSYVFLGYHYRYEINADPRLTNLSSNSDV